MTLQLAAAFLALTSACSGHVLTYAMIIWDVVGFKWNVWISWKFSWEIHEIFVGNFHGNSEISWDLVGFDGDLTEFNGDLMDTYFVDVWCSSFISGKSNGFTVVYLGVDMMQLGIHHHPFVLFRHPSEWHHHSERHGLKSDGTISSVSPKMGFCDPLSPWNAQEKMEKNGDSSFGILEEFLLGYPCSNPTGEEWCLVLAGCRWSPTVVRSHQSDSPAFKTSCTTSSHNQRTWKPLCSSQKNAQNQRESVIVPLNPWVIVPKSKRIQYPWMMVPLKSTSPTFSSQNRSRLRPPQLPRWQRSAPCASRISRFFHHDAEQRGKLSYVKPFTYWGSNQIMQFFEMILEFNMAIWSFSHEIGCLHSYLSPFVWVFFHGNNWWNLTSGHVLQCAMENHPMLLR